MSGLSVFLDVRYFTSTLRLILYVDWLGDLNESLSLSYTAYLTVILPVLTGNIYISYF